MAFLEEQGLRSEDESSNWILIAVPGLHEVMSPNWVTITTADIQTCLTAAGRSRVDIDAICLSAHSRSARGLEHTLGFGGAPTIDLSKVERVTVFDASYHDLGVALTSHLKDLTAMPEPGHPARFRAGAVNLYDVTVRNISGLPGRSLGVQDGPRSHRSPLACRRAVARGGRLTRSWGRAVAAWTTYRCLLRHPEHGVRSSDSDRGRLGRSEPGWRRCGALCVFLARTGRCASALWLRCVPSRRQSL